MKSHKGAIMVGLVLLGSPAMGDDSLYPVLDTQIPSYSPQNQLSEKVQIVGSNTMATILKKWKDQLELIHPDLEIILETAGSNPGVNSLISGSTTIAAMSRPMNNEEIGTFTEQIGYPPTSVPVAVDAFAVFVHKDNPLNRITFQQLDAIFSSERRRGSPESLDRWGQLGISGAWAETPITIHIRDGKSGTGQFFRESVMLGGKEKNAVMVQPGAASVVNAVMNDPNAIGYSGIGYRTNSVKPLYVSVKEGDPSVEPTFESATNGTYPLRRVFYLYVNHQPNGRPSPHMSEIIRFAVSMEGQQVVAKSGFFPLPTKDLLALWANWTKPLRSASTKMNLK